jgi:hypothetical protein
VTVRRLRLGVVILLATAGIGIATIPGDTASAWSNGPPQQPDAFGTHDWFLYVAVTALGERARWIDRDIALEATDDPDHLNRIPYASDHKWHNYDRWGKNRYGRAPRAVEIWFRRAVRALRDDRIEEASRAAGIMAHLVSDVANPMHTDGWASAEDRVHRRYEEAVDERCQGDPSACIYRFNFDGANTSARPARRTRIVARRSHPVYAKLVNTFASDGYGRPGTVHRITRWKLNLGANAVADLIASIGARADSSPRSVTARSSEAGGLTPRTVSRRGCPPAPSRVLSCGRTRGIGGMPPLSAL